MEVQDQRVHMHPDTSKKVPRHQSQKKFKIIVNGVEEQRAHTDRSKRQKQDLERVVEVLKIIEESIEDGAIRDLHRLGEYNTEVHKRPRPILVELVRSIDVSKILEKNSKGKISKQVTPYFTPKEVVDRYAKRRKKHQAAESEGREDSMSDQDRTNNN